MTKRTIYMESTKIEAEQTIGDIMRLLKKHGLRQSQFKYDDSGKIAAVNFAIEINGQLIGYTLPAKTEPLLRFAANKETKYLKPGDREQAQRIAWRQIIRWIEAQLALIETEMVSIEEVMLPYMIIDNTGRTLAEQTKERGIAGYLK